MRNFISNADESLKIEGFTDLIWDKRKEPAADNYLQKELFKLETVIDNIKENAGYYIAKNKGGSILSNIGKQPHPMIPLAYATVWYNSNFGGIYLIGIDNIKNEYFAPIKK